MMKLDVDEEAGVAEITVEGKVTGAEYDAAIPVMEGLIERHGKMRAVVVLRDFKGADPAAWWRDLTWGMGHLARLERAAVVTDTGWIGLVTRVSNAVSPTEMRLFGLAELDAARAWVREG